MFPETIFLLLRQSDNVSSVFDVCCEIYGLTMVADITHDYHIGFFLLNSLNPSPSFSAVTKPLVFLQVAQHPIISQQHRLTPAKCHHHPGDGIRAIMAYSL